MLYAISHEVYFISEYNDYTIELNDEAYELTSTEPLYIGLFLPGQVNYVVGSDLGYLQATQQQTFTVSPSEETVHLVEMELINVEVTSAYPSAMLVIDGEQTDIEIIEATKFSLPAGSTFELTAQLTVADETYTSEAINVSEDDIVHFTFEDQEISTTALTEEEAIDFIDSFRVQFEQAINTINFGLIEDYFVEGSQQQKDYKQFIDDHEKFGVYSYLFNDNIYEGFESINLQQGVLKTAETFVYTSEEEGTYLYEREKEYTITYNTAKQSYEIETIKIIDTKKTKQ